MGTFTRHHSIEPTVVLGFQKIGQYLRFSSLTVDVDSGQTIWSTTGEIYNLYASLIIHFILGHQNVFPEQDGVSAGGVISRRDSFKIFLQNLPAWLKLSIFFLVFGVV